MRLKLTLRGGDAATDLVVTADPEATVGQLADELAAHSGGLTSRPRRGAVPTLRRFASGSADGGLLLPAAARLGDAPLASGDTVEVAYGPRRDPAAVPVARVEVLGGPAPGRTHDLGAGSWVLGRDPRCDIVLEDPMVSARHARLRVGAALELVDLGSANGIGVGDATVGRARLDDGQRFVLGRTRLRVERLAEPPPTTRGEVRVVRSPRVEPRHAGERLTAPAPPGAPEPERPPWLLALVPLVLGVGLAVVLGRPAALLFALAAPVMLLGGFLSQRSRRRRRHRAAMAAFAASLDELEMRLEHLAAAERAARSAEAPAPRLLSDAVATHGPLLWTRRPEHWNFLTVRLGTAPLPSRTVVAVPPTTDLDSTGLGPAARERLEGLRDRVLPDLPVVERLGDAGALGLAGDAAQTAPVLAALVTHLVGLHSPTELVVAAALSADWARRLCWLPWLPHASPSPSPLGDVPLLASERDHVVALVDALERVVSARTAGPDAPASLGPLPRAEAAIDGPGDRPPGRTAAGLPAIAVVLSADAELPLERCIALSEAGPAVGVHPIWVAAEHGSLPAACRTSVEVTGPGVGAVRFVRLGEELAPVRLDTVALDEAQLLARRLAPLRDAGAPPAAQADLPGRVALADLLGPALLDEPEAVLGRWREHAAAPTARGLPALIGRGRDGPARLDLRRQGPHALVAGTTGSGKSEFLRAWVAGLAAEHSPERVNFLFVDYKGGAAFADCVRLPHCVGLVTDLAPRLVRRVLVSLGAELRRRERLFARLGASELTELESRTHPETPPALVLVVDEFAALTREVPEFVDGVLDLAQRGRALGMHLILATQRPAGVVKEGIKANASLRVALRTADAADSLDVLGVVDAASPGMSPPGRALVRAGAGQLEVVQSAFTGGRTGPGARLPAVDVAPLGFIAAPGDLGETDGRNAHPVDRDAPTDLDRLVATVTAATARVGIPPPRRPWLDELPPTVDLAGLLTGDDAVIPLGLSDAPAEQDRRLAAFRPDQDGHLAVLGASGSGKSAALRSIAVATAVTPRGGPVELYGLDFASGALRSLEALPHVGSVVPGDDVERVHRLLRRLGASLAERTVLWAALHTTGLPDLRRRPGRSGMARIVLLVDGFPAFRDEWEGRSGRASDYETFRELLAIGRSLGMHVALTADRAGALPSSVAAAVQRRVELWDEPGAAGVPRLPGRGVVAGLETQLALLGPRDRDAAQREESVVIADYARRHVASIPVTPPVRSLPRRFPPTELPARAGGRPVLGLAADTLEPLAFEPRGSLLVAGPPGSGRTNALAWIARSLRSADPSVRAMLLAPYESSLAGRHGFADHSVVGVEAVAEAVRGLLRPAGPPASLAILVESVARFAGTAAEAPLAELVRRLRATGGLIVAEEHLAGWAGVDPLLVELRSARRGLLLQPEPSDAETLLRVSLPRTMQVALPPGRGVLVDQGRTTVVQLPHIADDR